MSRDPGDSGLDKYEDFVYLSLVQESCENRHGFHVSGEAGGNAGDWKSEMLKKYLIVLLTIPFDWTYQDTFRKVLSDVLIQIQIQQIPSYVLMVLTVLTVPNLEKKY